MGPNRTIRIKITGDCNRNCCFCHKEGNMASIQNVVFDDELKGIIDKLQNDFSVENVALTGGEPLLYPDIVGFVHSVKTETNIKNISITTNGTIKLASSAWEQMKNDGLFKVNISIPEILNNTKSDGEVSTLFSNQIELIRLLNELEIQVDINIVVYNDFYTVDNVLRRLTIIKNECNVTFDIMLLPDLLNYSKSIDAIKKVRDIHSLDKLSITNVAGTSNAIETYYSKEFGEIYIKTTKLSGMPFRIPLMCSKCNIKDICQEGFYGLRLECRNRKNHIRLCIHKDTDDVVIAFEKFVKSKLYKELVKIFRQNKE